mmetsp:Transcript_2264/g.6477  ORF Transcript_2264/g.6477 Transcript_2264/m.6477 type:complete len:217 (-) Transcript_2264:404-1054(-)
MGPQQVLDRDAMIVSQGRVRTGLHEGSQYELTPGRCGEVQRRAANAVKEEMFLSTMSAEPVEEDEVRRQQPPNAPECRPKTIRQGDAGFDQHACHLLRRIEGCRCVQCVHAMDAASPRNAMGQGEAHRINFVGGNRYIQQSHCHGVPLRHVCAAPHQLLLHLHDTRDHGEEHGRIAEFGALVQVCALLHEHRGRNCMSMQRRHVQRAHAGEDPERR